MAADRTLVACLLKINGLDELAVYKKHLQEQRDRYRIANDSLIDEVMVRRNQGRIMQLNDLLDELEQAPALASKIGG